LKFCSNCAAPVSRRIPPGDNLPRWVFDTCHAIHYENPRMIVGCVAEWDGKILLCKRAIEPRHGLWTVPAGFLEQGETTAEGAQRETLEEANARVEIATLFSLYNLPHINQVYLLFRGRLLDADVSAGAETLETHLFEAADIPWDQLAFATVRATLTHYLSDRATGHFGFHIGTVKGRAETTDYARFP
jgi:ADP-ribose pyrophosphatase YjhB (NUDIX family)